MFLLQEWLSTADQRYCYLSSGGALVPVLFNKFVVGMAGADAQNRKRKRTTFAPETVQALNREFEVNSTPNQFRYMCEEIRFRFLWF